MTNPSLWTERAAGWLAVDEPTHGCSRKSAHLLWREVPQSDQPLPTQPQQPPGALQRCSGDGWLRSSLRWSDMISCDTGAWYSSA